MTVGDWNRRAPQSDALAEAGAVVNAWRDTTPDRLQVLSPKLNHAIAQLAAFLAAPRPERTYSAEEQRRKDFMAGALYYNEACEGKTWSVILVDLEAEALRRYGERKDPESCPECEGRGSKDDYDERECDACGGTGERKDGEAGG